MNNIHIRMFFIPWLSLKIRCKSDLNDIVTKFLDCVCDRKDIGIMRKRKNSTKFFWGTFANYKFDLYPMHRVEYRNILNDYSNLDNISGNILTPHIYGSLKKHNSTYILYLKMSASPLHPLLWIFPILIEMIGIIYRDPVRFFVGLVIYIIIQKSYYSTAKKAIDHILEIVDGDIV
ncbi:hypothetical protein SAMN02910298_01463 [Pseudobutyrivibrio sp. YE44]|uniref:hypothetical protein n=1 Tax=Pseudobutyrivibrio sp. YE44 TaxID=1520802 RepID=UPI00088EFB27|nr:hypothetical protein [Pseudobutyrivibrio sp. YE44]SDB29812.1 hypothetical protein SAMN02910298_01463 [Pseudobutyrivibrio sp. YE44]